MEYVDCNLCGSNRNKMVFSQKDLSFPAASPEYTVVRCLNCGLMYLNPRPDPEEMAAHYPSEYYGIPPGRPKMGIEHMWKSFSKRLKRWIMEDYYGYPRKASPVFWTHLRKWLLLPEVIHLILKQKDILPYVGEGKLLDVGCGAGVNLVRLQEYGWKVYGVDLSAVAVERARERVGDCVFQGDLHSVKFEDKYFDVIIFSHSLEHMHNPRSALTEARRILKDGGRLIVCLPNAASWEVGVFSKWWCQWDLPRHLYHFNRCTLQTILEKTGFGIVRIRTGIGSVFFMKSLEYVFKHKWDKIIFAKKLIDRCVASPFTFIAGQLGYGTEIMVYVEKSDDINSVNESYKGDVLH